MANNFQWVSIDEWQRAVARSKDNPPDAMGGFGFDAKRDPSLTCPNCYGEGVASVHINDTRHLSRGARLLYKSAKQDRFGVVSVEVQDQHAIRKDLMQVMGLLGKDGQSLLPAFKDTTEAPAQAATPEQARDAYLKMIKR